MASLRSGRGAALIAALPTGTVPVALGLLVAGISAYAFQILAFRVLGASSYAALNGLWVTAFVLAPGLFLPLEQEVARAVAHRHSQGQGMRPLIKKASLLGAVLIVAVVVVVVVLRAPIEERLLRGSDELFGALIAVLIGFALESLARGTLSGNGRFGRYGLVVGVDGLSRVALAGVIAAVSVGTLGWFGIAFAAAPFIATIAGLAGARGLIEPGPPAAMSELSTAIGWLLLGSVFCQALGYSAYIGASLIATPAQDAELGGFVAGLFVARVPLLLFQAVQAALLPKLARMLGQGQVAEFRAGLLRLCSVLVVLSIVCVAVALTIGPWLGRLLFGEKFELNAGGLAMLTAGCCLIVLALTLAQALIALQRYAVTGLAWVFGLAVFTVVFLLPDGDAFFRSEVAFLAGAAAAVAWMGVTAVRSLQSVDGAPVVSGD